MIDDQTFREAMGKFATGITIVTTAYEGETQGMTVNAFMSVSLQPKLIAVSIGNQAEMYQTLQKTDRFGISILKEDQKDLSMIFAKQKEKDRELHYIEHEGIPLLRDSLATLSCTTQNIVEAGDHMILIAEVNHLTVDEGSPILYFDGNYESFHNKLE